MNTQIFESQILLTSMSIGHLSLVKHLVDLEIKRKKNVLDVYSHELMVIYYKHILRTQCVERFMGDIQNVDI